MSRRRIAVVGVAVLVTAGLVTAGILASSDDSGSEIARPRRSESLQPVRTRTLENTTDVSGTIGYGNATTVRLNATSSGSSTAAGASNLGAGGSTAASSSGTSDAGVITALPSVGTVITTGQSLAEVDGRPSAFLMVGSRPMWRTLQSGISDGPDVRQLEENLAFLGYADSFTLDDEFTSGTASAIKAWQEANGIEQTGALTTSDIVFLPGAVRLASQVATIGGSASGDILTVTGMTPVIHVDLDATDVGSVHPGDVLNIDLPDSSTVEGVVLVVGSPTTSSATAQGQATTTTTVGVDIVVTQSDIASFDGATAVVHLVTSKAENALSVPVKSLLALAEGGYAVERVRNGHRSLVAVTTAVFAGGFVQVRGALKAGDRVVTP